MRLLSASLLFLVLPAFADVIFLKDGTRYEGMLLPSGEPGMVVLATSELERAKAIDPVATGWKVEIRGDGAEITLPKDLVEEAVDPSRHAAPLIRALEHPDKRVRYAAARALVAMRPKRDFMGSDRVILNLADAIGEAGIRVVLVVTDDTDLSNRTAARVRGAGYVAVQAFSVPDCLGALKRSPTKDLVLLDATLGRLELSKAAARAPSPDESLVRRIEQITHYQAGDRDLPVEKRYARELFLQLQEDYRTRTVPVVVLADEGDVDLVKSIYEGSRVASVLPKSGDEGRLKGALAAVFQRQDPALQDSKDLADEASLAACRSLATLSRQDPVFRVSDAEEALLRALSESAQPRRADFVREGALRAVGAIGTPSCYDELLKVLGNGENPVALRRAAAEAIADIARASGVKCPDAVVTGLQAALRDPDPGIWQASARGLGVAQIPPARVRDVLLQERLEKPLKE